MTDTAPPGGKIGWWTRWRSTILVVSLALNMLVLGIVTAGAVRHRLWPHPPAMVATLAGFARELPAARRSEIWKATSAERATLRPFRKELRGLRDTVRAALAAEPFDAARFSEAQERLMQGELRARRAAYALHAAIAMRMTPEERRAFAAWQPRAERWSRWRHRRGPPRGEPADDDAAEAAAPTTAKPGTAASPATKP